MSDPGFRVLENQYFEEAKRLAEEERKRRLLGVRPEPSVPKDGKNQKTRVSLGGLFDADSVSGLSAGLGVLSTTRHVFIQRAGNEFVDKFFELENRFDLLNSTGERIFFAGETIQAQTQEQSSCFRLVTPPFDVSVVGCDGGGVLSVVSRSSGTATISDFRNVLGTINARREFACCCGLLCGTMTTYTVKDKTGAEIYKIGPSSAAAGREMEFNVFTKDIKQLIGRISRKWTGDEVPHHALWSTAYGISFPLSASIETKALLLGAMIAIVGHHNFQAVNDVTVYRSQNPSCLKPCSTTILFFSS